jgi:hypothetical protein
MGEVLRNAELTAIIQSTLNAGDVVGQNAGPAADGSQGAAFGFPAPVNAPELSSGPDPVSTLDDNGPSTLDI